MASTTHSPIFILGSAPNYVIPDESPRAIYTANRAVELVPKASGHASEVCHVTSVVGSKEVRKPEIVEALTENTPDRLVVRGDANLEDLFSRDVLESMDVVKLDEKGLEFQRRYLTDWQLARSSFDSARKLVSPKKWRNAVFKFGRGGVQGVSTGLFAALFAADEHPQAPIVLIGITFLGGEHFYGTGQMSQQRAFADRYLLPKLPPSIQNRLFTTDPHTASTMAMPIY